MSRVAQAFVAWTWETFDILIRLNAGTSGRNIHSQRVLKKAGFVFECRRENAITKNGEVDAELLFGALKPT